MPLAITADSDEFITLAELKAHLNKTGDADDVELETFRASAQDHVEELVGPVLWREVTQASRGCALALHTLPVVAVDTVDGGDPADYTVDLEAGIVEGLPTVERVDVVYTAGRTECPDAIRMATLIIGKHLWETQRGRASNRAGGAVEGEQRLPAGFLIPHRAEALLRPHMLSVGFA
jgi:hypothetical protein